MQEDIKKGNQKFEAQYSLIVAHVARVLANPKKQLLIDFLRGELDLRKSHLANEIILKHNLKTEGVAERVASEIDIQEEMFKGCATSLIDAVKSGCKKDIAVSLYLMENKTAAQKLAIKLGVERELEAFNDQANQYEKILIDNLNKLAKSKGIRGKRSSDKR